MYDYGSERFVPVKVGRDYRGTVEFVSGLPPSDMVILDPADSLITMRPVRVNRPSGGEVR